MSNHALLLRLLISPYFSVSVALNYLSAYSDNVGITYYLTRRLKELDTSELRDVWGFICHLLVSRPSKSRALECFVVEISQRSTHIAMLTLWFMQAALHDLSLNRTNSPSFIICQRTLHQCHEIIFGDLPPPASTPYSHITAPFASRFKRKVKHHAEPVIIGIGAMLAGVPGMPKITEVMGEVAIQQGRIEDTGESMQRQGMNDDRAEGLVTSSPVEEDEEPPPVVPQQTTRTKPSTRRNTVTAAQTTPALPLHLRTHRKPRMSDDPLGQLDPDSEASRSPSPFQSTPSFSPRAYQRPKDHSDSLLQQYDKPSQIHMLRGQFCRNEVRFLLTLENICNRLLVVPRPARVSALRAELTALNHKLPAEVCMPMWCFSSDEQKLQNDIPAPHHRIVRIPPGESVVLNSAERAPYLLLIEVLGDDLDFDPAKRGNREILKKAVLKSSRRQDSNPFNSPPSKLPSGDYGQDPEVAKVGLGITALHVIPATPTSVEAKLADDEEIDLVEQLYGADQSLRTPDLSETIVLPPKPKNRELDMMTWSRSNSMPPSPAIGGIPDFSAPKALTSNLSSPQPDNLADGFDTPKVMSMDDYSERMRTAAIMLAQLNANQVREPITTPSTPRPSGDGSWLSGLNLRSNDSSGEGAGKGPVHPSLASGSADNTGTPTRMKLSHVDAAAIRDRIMKEMLALEGERMQRMKENREGDGYIRVGGVSGAKSAEDESIIRRELEKADPSALVFKESWAVKKSRIRTGSPYGHLANWDCVSVIVKTGADLRQEQLAVELIREFQQIWRDENCPCWVRYFRILITGGTSGLVETITDAVSIHSIKKAEYARRLATGRLGTVTLMDHFCTTYGDPSSAKFARAQRNFAKSLAGYSIVTFLLQIKDRHNGNILLDRDGHLIHIDFGFMLSNSPGNIGFEAAPFKLSSEYIEVLGGITSSAFLEFRRLFREGFEVARKHCDRIITLIELMQRDSSLPCFAAFGEQTANQLRERFQPALTHALVGDYVDRLIDTSLNSNWTRLYDSYQYYSQSIL